MPEPRPCRDCGSTRISPAQLRKYNYVCRSCHARRERIRCNGTSAYRRTGTKVETLVIDAVMKHGLPTTVNELAETTGIPKRIIASRVSDLVAIGILRHTGGRIRYGNGGPSFCFELASHAERRRAISRNIAHQQALVEPGAREHSKATQAEVML
jgi:hypothetical protein